MLICISFLVEALHLVLLRPWRRVSCRMQLQCDEAQGKYFFLLYNLVLKYISSQSGYGTCDKLI